MKQPVSFFTCLWRKPCLMVLSFVIFLLSCKRTTEPKFPVADLQLTVQDVSCTEAWLSLKAGDSLLGDTLKLYGNDSLILSHELNAADSLVYADSLPPATEYAFEARIYDGGALLAASPKVTATTMDTTSHNFTWQTFEFGGQGGSSAFYDVAIIDQNDAWAVGEIYTADETYNAAHWNGEKWELRKVPYVDKTGYVWITPLYSIFAFSSNDIWFESGVHWNGSRFVSLRMNINFPSHVNKIWGTSDNDLYIVGNNGLIAHYDGRQWQRIESGTDLPIQDIWGALNKEKGEYEILCVASNEYNNYGKKIIKIENKKATFIQDDGLPWSLSSIWFIPNRIYYACGDGIFSKKIFSNKWEKYKNTIPIYKERIRGQGFNSIFVCGDFGLMSYFNGRHWYHYLNKELPKFSGAYYSLDYKSNSVVAVGEKLDQSIDTKAVILVGQKN